MKKNACFEARRGQTKAFYSHNKMCKVTLIPVAMLAKLKNKTISVTYFIHFTRYSEIALEPKVSEMQKEP